jgi:hypothetical protein
MPESPSFATPELIGSRYRFQAGALVLEVDAAQGGRIREFSRSGRNILTGPEVVAGGDAQLRNLFGSTFWTSPQSVWGWPPEEPIDSGPYRARVDQHALVLVSDPGPITHYAVEKRIELDRVGERLVLNYTLLPGAGALAAAPWEITRVRKAGLVFFPAASEPVAPSTLQSELRDGIAWIGLDNPPSSDAKLFQAGTEGWLAYAVDDLVLIKSFENVPRTAQAPGEADVELYINGGYDYVELEQQGAYVEPSPAGQTWRVVWQLLERPASVAATLGNRELVDWVRQRRAP